MHGQTTMDSVYFVFVRIVRSQLTNSFQVELFFKKKSGNLLTLNKKNEREKPTEWNVSCVWKYGHQLKIKQ